MYAIGLKVLHRYCEKGDVLGWHKAQLSPLLFKAHELPTFEWVSNHVRQHHVLPQLPTLYEMFPDMKGTDAIEPPSYYVDLLEKAYCFERINRGNIDSQTALKNNQNIDLALTQIEQTIKDIRGLKNRQHVIDVGQDGYGMILTAYSNQAHQPRIAEFGWPYVDEQVGGGRLGDVISFVGRPALGKTWAMLWAAIYNWLAGRNVLFAALEMDKLAILQRIASVYTKSNIGQLKTATYATSTFNKFEQRLGGFETEKAKLIVVGANLGATPEEIYSLADMYECPLVYVDGAYLLRNHNTRLDRISRVNENVETMKRKSEDQFCTFASWQFNREASKKQKKAGKASTDLEDIALSDSIGQISNVVMGMYQEDSVETKAQRDIRIMKGRSGEMGQFSIKWNFYVMDFSQAEPALTEYIDKKDWM